MEFERKAAPMVELTLRVQNDIISNVGDLFDRLLSRIGLTYNRRRDSFRKVKLLKISGNEGFCLNEGFWICLDNICCLGGAEVGKGYASHDSVIVGLTNRPLTYITSRQ